MKNRGLLKSFVTLGVASILSTALSSCVFEMVKNASVSVSMGEMIEGSGVVSTRGSNIAKFDELDVSSDVNVVFNIGGDFAYKLTADSVVIDDYEVSFINNELKVGYKYGITRYLNPDGIKTVFEITVPDYDSLPELDIDLSGASKLVLPAFNMVKLQLDGSGASDISVKGVKVNGPFEIDCSGASTIDCAEIKAVSIDCDCSGASKVSIEGATEDLNLDCSGASNTHADRLSVSKRAVIDCSGASHVNIGDLTGASATFKASGASGIKYTGEPNIESSNAYGASHVSRI
ncbi:MAG: DUF2807 domain-containing protein [Bacteroidales bacterium]|nr:DUF2807 domain-containing protein [Bacteroidales bacterium]